MKKVLYVILVIGFLLTNCLGDNSVEPVKVAPAKTELTTDDLIKYVKWSDLSNHRLEIVTAGEVMIPYLLKVVFRDNKLSVPVTTSRIKCSALYLIGNILRCYGGISNKSLERISSLLVSAPEDPLIRSAVLFVLCEANNPERSKYIEGLLLKVALEDPYLELRILAVDNLGRFGSKDLLPILKIEYTRSEFGRMKVQAARAIFRIDPKDQFLRALIVDNRESSSRDFVVRLREHLGFFGKEIAPLVDDIIKNSHDEELISCLNHRKKFLIEHGDPDVTREEMLRLIFLSWESPRIIMQDLKWKMYEGRWVNISKEVKLLGDYFSGN